MKKDKFNPDYSAKNGLFDRRSFLKASIASGSGMMIAGAHASEDKIRSSWMGMPGEGMGESGPSEYERHIKRADIGSQPGTVGSGASRTPIQFLDGIITPSRLHFERHHSGIPNINPDEHRLVIHGLVDRQLSFSLEDLHRYK